MKKNKPIKVRRTWNRKPVQKVVESKKKYSRKNKPIFREYFD